MLNLAEDDRRAVERRREEIEYGGFFANPDVYAQVVGKGKENFQIVRDTSAYERKLDAASKDKVSTRGRRRDIAATVARKRAQFSEATGRPIPALARRGAVPVTPDDDDDDLLIEG